MADREEIRYPTIKRLRCFFSGGKEVWFCVLFFSMMFVMYIPDEFQNPQLGFFFERVRRNAPIFLFPLLDTCKQVRKTSEENTYSEGILQRMADWKGRSASFGRRWVEDEVPLSKVEEGNERGKNESIKRLAVNRRRVLDGICLWHRGVTTSVGNGSCSRLTFQGTGTMEYRPAKAKMAL